jgi:hypothetical protein
VIQIKQQPINYNAIIERALPDGPSRLIYSSEPVDFISINATAHVEREHGFTAYRRRRSFIKLTERVYSGGAAPDAPRNDVSPMSPFIKE